MDTCVSRSLLCFALFGKDERVGGRYHTRSGEVSPSEPAAVAAHATVTRIFIGYVRRTLVGCACSVSYLLDLPGVRPSARLFAFRLQSKVKHKPGVAYTLVTVMVQAFVVACCQRQASVFLCYTRCWAGNWGVSWLPLT